MRVKFSAKDMGEFIAAVQNRFVFQTCVSRCLWLRTSSVWKETTDDD